MAEIWDSKKNKMAIVEKSEHGKHGRWSAKWKKVEWLEWL